ncbi:cobalamin biosynthesis protein [Streptomyces palmae]|uniref:cobalamin biosynthesis protein n=1 Tax=Streptomyces palmae TaxID=1701085 RepID=UPI001FD82280|nr:cobalamin biosynthesis protein [Streptomyces palmae]
MRGVSPRRPLTVGVGARPGVAEAEVRELVLRTLAEAGQPPSAVAALATTAARAGEPGLTAVAAGLGVPLLAFAATRLASVQVPSPSARVRAATGTPSVAEAAALLAAGPDGELLVRKRKSTPSPGALASATCAVAAARP